MAETKTYPLLKKGSKGADVKDLKIYLSEKGYTIDLTTDEYDATTEAAVKQFQQENGLKDDGEAGKNTLGYIDKTSESKKYRNYNVADVAPRKGVRDNKDGTVSSHLMGWGEIDGKYIAYPTLFQNEDGTWVQAKDSKEAVSMAIERGELFEFDDEKSASEFAAGNWKPKEEAPIEENAMNPNIKPKPVSPFNEFLYKPTTLNVPPTTRSTPSTPSTTKSKGLWDGLNLRQYEMLAGTAEPGGFVQPILNPEYSVSRAAKEKLSEEKTTNQEGNSLTSFLMDKLGDNLEKNKTDVIKDRAFNDVISIGELANNLNEAPYNEVSNIEAGKMQAAKMSNNTMIDNIDRQKNSQIKYMRSIGRQDLIPSIIAATDNKKAEMAEQLNNTNANIETSANQVNLQTETQTKAANSNIDQFNRQMFERAEINKGAAISQNITNLRNSSRDYTNNMTGVRDNDLSYLMYMAATQDPNIQKSLSYFMNQKIKNSRRNNQYIYNSEGKDQNGNSVR